MQFEEINDYYAEVFQKVQIFHVHTTDEEADDHVQIDMQTSTPRTSQGKNVCLSFF